jgi:16S rRNA (uracil1498-N3)-methyltransferase
MQPSVNRATPIPRFHVAPPLATGMQVQLPDAVSHHVRVLRLTVGDRISLCDGTGGDYSARLDAVDRNVASAVIDEHFERECESPVAVDLAQAMSSGDRMDYTIQKAVELGAVAIQPIAAARSVVHLSGERAERRVAHWQALAIAACEQCGRNRIPTVHEILPLANWLDTRDDAIGARLLLSPRAELSLKNVQPKLDRAVALLAGPEGGFTDAEEQQAIRAGFVAIRLGPRVLRTESAAAAAIAAMQTLWGDF